MARIYSVVWQKIVIYNQDKKILILKRSTTSNGAGNRDLPWGGLELYEDSMETVSREVLEETGLLIKDIVPVYTKAKTFEDNTHSFFVWYKWTLDSDSEVVLSHEHDEYKWIDPKEIDVYNLKGRRAETVKRSMKNL